MIFGMRNALVGQILRTTPMVKINPWKRKKGTNQKSVKKVGAKAKIVILKKIMTFKPLNCGNREEM